MALPHNTAVFTGVSSKAAWLHHGRANLEHRQLHPEEQGGKFAESPLLTRGPDILQHF